MCSYYILIFIVAYFVLVVSKSTKSNSKAHTTRKSAIVKQSTDAFESLSSFYNGVIGSYSDTEIGNALKKIASNQAALKSLDGVAHQFKHATGDRLKKFLSSKKKNTSSSRRKEASKLLEYVNVIERSLQACEILHAISLKEGLSRTKALNNTHLTEIAHFNMKNGFLKWKISILTPMQTTVYRENTTYVVDSNDLMARYTDNEIVIAISDVYDCRPRPNNPKKHLRKIQNSIMTTLKLAVKTEIDYLPLKSSGLLNEDVTVHKTILKLSLLTIMKLHSFLFVAIKPNVTQHIDQNTSMKNETNIPIIPLNTRKYSNIKIVGYSLGASIGSYVAMMLDGGLNLSFPETLYSSLNETNNVENVTNNDVAKDSNSSSIHKDIKTAETVQNDLSDISVKSKIDNLIGLYEKDVKCICIAPFPCISRTITPQYISSVICGDDIVPRATPETMSKLKKRLKEALKSGAGKGSVLWNLGGAWLNDAKYLASNSINQYASGAHDTSSLTLPGRVFYIKKRKLKKGGSIQRVFRGNWREDMLWVLHEILLSSKMMSHHDLMYCAQTLARV